MLTATQQLVTPDCYPLHSVAIETVLASLLLDEWLVLQGRERVAQFLGKESVAYDQYKVTETGYNRRNTFVDIRDSYCNQNFVIGRW